MTKIFNKKDESTVTVSFEKNADVLKYEISSELELLQERKKSLLERQTEIASAIQSINTRLTEINKENTDLEVKFPTPVEVAEAEIIPE